MRRKVNILKSLDWFTVSIYFVLIIIGWISIYAAVYNEEHYSIWDITQRYGKQLIWIILAIGIAIVCIVIDSNFYTFFAYIIYGLLMSTLIAVLLFGREIHGARSWFEIGSFRVQPAEFAKFGTCLVVAKLLSSYNFHISGVKNLLKIVAALVFPAILIILQNDTGSALVYFAFILVLYREGMSGAILILCVLMALLFLISLVLELYAIVLLLSILAVLFFAIYSKKIKTSIIYCIISGSLFAIIYEVNNFSALHIPLHIVIIIALTISLIPVLVYIYRGRLSYIYYIILVFTGAVSFTFSVDYFFNKVLEDHQRTRINVLLGFEEDLKGAGYNVNQSKIAIGSGGVYGKGFLQGTQTKFDFVPEQSTDFIFCTIGEEWGFIGSTVVILLFCALLIRLIQLAERQRSKFSRIYGYGVMSIILFHFAINIGMTIGLTPVIGIPLPFISYGGSSLWAFTILLFVFLRLDASRMELL